MKKLALVVLLAGCTSTPQPEVIIPPPVVVSPILIHPPLPMPLDLQTPKFYVLTQDNIQEFFQKEKTPVIYAVDTAGYQALSGNVQEMRRYILELQNVVKYYKASIEAQKNENGTTR